MTPIRELVAYFGLRRIIQEAAVVAFALAVLFAGCLFVAAVDRVTSEPYAPTRANPTFAGVDATGEANNVR